MTFRIRGYQSVKHYTKVVYPKLKFIPCIDSLHSSNVEEVSWKWMYLCSESCNQSSQQISSCEWKYHDSKDAPTQKNTNDCGAFVCFAARQLVEGLP
ncbi:hypothetical protein EMCRGX_G018365 [Ephydatia muelleri]